MPLYEYICEKCKKEFEDFKHIDERNEAICPNCGKGDNIKLLISRGGDDWFKPHWNDGFDIMPIYVESKQHYKQLCEKYKVRAKCLM